MGCLSSKSSVAPEPSVAPESSVAPEPNVASKDFAENTFLLKKAQFKLDCAQNIRNLENEYGVSTVESDREIEFLEYFIQKYNVMIEYLSISKKKPENYDTVLEWQTETRAKMVEIMPKLKQYFHHKPDLIRKCENIISMLS